MKATDKTGCANKGSKNFPGSTPARTGGCSQKFIPGLLELPVRPNRHPLPLDPESTSVPPPPPDLFLDPPPASVPGHRWTGSPTRLGTGSWTHCTLGATAAACHFDGVGLVKILASVAIEAFQGTTDACRVQQWGLNTNRKRNNALNSTERGVRKKTLFFIV